MWQDSQRSTMLASATLICWIVGSVSSSSFQSVDLRRRQIDHVVGDVVVEAWFLASVTGLSMSPSSAFSLVRSSFSSLYVSSSCGKLYFSCCRRDTRPSRFSVLYSSRSFCLLCFAGWLVLGLDLVGERIDVGAAVGEDGLHGENFGVEIADLLLQFRACAARPAVWLDHRFCLSF